MHARRLLLAGLTAIAVAAAQDLQSGKRTFESQCAACHGADGNGGEFAPGIVTRLVARTDSDLSTLIGDGLPNRGMPAFTLDKAHMRDLISYLRTLRPPRRGYMVPVPMTVATTDGKKLSGMAVNRSFADM